ncbi:MAG: insulinase family protein [Anaerolineae bacterium]|nr:insulinase family protein [Anaerolineae bacterium]
MYSRKPKRSLPGPDDTLRQTLPNGITVLARENFASPSVVISGYIEAGAEDELCTLHSSRNLCGLANFTTSVMERGTQSRSFDQLYEEIESVGARLGLSSGTHISTFGAKGLAEHLPLLLNITHDILRNPAFRTEQVEKERMEILTDFQERAQDTRRMASLLFRELIYPDTHPYHYSSSGYPETVSTITRDDLVNFHQQYFAPAGMTVVIVGAVKSEEMADIVADVFGDWSTTRPARTALPDVPPLTERKEQRLAIPEKTQSNLVLGWPGPPRQHPDFIPCYLTNNILGVFGMYGRLGKRVREENGLAYYAYSHIDGGKGPGAWRILAGINPTNIDKAIDLILEELKQIRENLVSKEELSNSQSFLIGSLPLQLETNEGVAHTLVNIERYNLGLDYLQRYQELISNVATWDVQKMAQRWLDPENFALAIAEPAVPA